MLMMEALPVWMGKLLIWSALSERDVVLYVEKYSFGTMNSLSRIPIPSVFTERTSMSKTNALLKNTTLTL